MIKARIVRLGGKGAAGAIAHLRYIERDGTDRAGARGQTYGPGSDAVDGRAFVARGADDRHQFRFIVSAEDGADYEDLKPLTRRLMAQAEIDLGTRLDWVAIDHFNTGHPHTHILVRGVDERGRDLVIPRDYLAAGLRGRAAALVALDLGPPSPLQERDRARREMTAERMTPLDHRFAAEADRDNIVTAHGGTTVQQALRVGRLMKLEGLGLARPIGAGRWRLEPGFLDTLRRLGERGDIVRTMQRTFARTGQDRAIADQHIYDPLRPGARPLVGRVLARGLADEHRDHEYLILDGVDGLTHYVPIGRGAIDDGDTLFGGGHGIAGATVRIAPHRHGALKADQVIASVAAANGGRYDAAAHRRFDPTASAAFVMAHVRRLEAVRRATRAVERETADRWTVPPDYLARVGMMERVRVRERPVKVELLAHMPLAQLANVEGATWLDREIVADRPTVLRAAGYGREVERAIEARRHWLSAQGLPSRPTHRDGAKLITDLQALDLNAAGAALATERGQPYTPLEANAQVEGVYRRRIDLVSGRFALIERAQDFTLLPWRPVLERALHRAIRATLRGDQIDWGLGRQRAGLSRGDM